MSDDNSTRRELLLGITAVPLLRSSLAAQSASSVCFMSTVEMARLIRAKKLSAREALAEHLKQI
jgi:amidase